MFDVHMNLILNGLSWQNISGIYQEYDVLYGQTSEGTDRFHYYLNFSLKEKNQKEVISGYFIYDKISHSREEENINRPYIKLIVLYFLKSLKILPKYK